MNIDRDTAADRDERAINAYLGGRMSAADAEAFEKRYLADDELARQLERTVELRAAFAAGDASVSTPGANRPRWPLALAAGMAMLLIGAGLLLQMQRDAVDNGAGTPLLRGDAGGFALLLDASDGVTLHCRWSAIAQADRYALQVLGGDGDLLLEFESAEPEQRVPWSRLPPDSNLLLRVQALDDFGQVIQSSELVPAGAGPQP